MLEFFVFNLCNFVGCSSQVHVSAVLFVACSELQTLYLKCGFLGVFRCCSLDLARADVLEFVRCCS